MTFAVWLIAKGFNKSVFHDYNLAIRASVFAWAGLLIGPTLLLLVIIVAFVRQDRTTSQELTS
ncbi:MAG: hypothetical protein ACFFAJ_18105 [Candidatus Hodarchaeota archaeon]